VQVRRLNPPGHGHFLQLALSSQLSNEAWCALPVHAEVIGHPAGGGEPQRTHREQRQLALGGFGG
jgi:hypothetical protein